MSSTELLQSILNAKWKLDADARMNKLKARKASEAAPKKQAEFDEALASLDDIIESFREESASFTPDESSRDEVFERIVRDELDHQFSTDSFRNMLENALDDALLKL